MCAHLFYHEGKERGDSVAEHIFKLKADWPGLRNDVGTIEACNLKTEISIPPEMDGPGVGTNPDEMLLGAAATHSRKKAFGLRKTLPTVTGGMPTMPL